MFKKILAYSLFFLFAFFFAGKQSYASEGAQSTVSTIHQCYTCHPSQHLFSIAHPLHHSPLESLPTEKEEEPTNEEELKDNSDNGKDLFILKNLAHSISNTSNTVKSNFYQRIHAVQNRTAVPFFILFLSWKSFLI